jgi:hypothetical protein
MLKIEDLIESKEQEMDNNEMSEVVGGWAYGSGRRFDAIRWTPRWITTITLTDDPQ